MSEQERRFAVRVRNVRKIRGMSQQHLGDLCGIQRSVLANIETCRREAVTVAEASALCDALGVELCEMLAEGPMKLRVETAVD